MKNTKYLYLLILLFLFLSCNNSSTIEYKEYPIGDKTLKIKVPENFEEQTTEYVDKFAKEGHELLKKSGFLTAENQKSIFFFRKGEFSLIKAKSSKIEQKIIDNYEVYLDTLKNVLYKALSDVALEIENTPIDTISRIEQINDIKFYVIETNIIFYDLKNNPVNHKALRYSTVINNLDFVIDISYFNDIDEKNILDSLKSIEIK